MVEPSTFLRSVCARRTFLINHGNTGAESSTSTWLSSLHHIEWRTTNKDGKKRFYFDSISQVILQEIADYLKTETEKQNDEAVIARNTDIVQKFSTKICGHQCLYVLKSFSIGESHRDILEFLTKKDSGITWTNYIAN